MYRFKVVQGTALKPVRTNAALAKNIETIHDSFLRALQMNPALMEKNMALKLTIIGSGPGGHTAAFAAASAGAEVTLIERGHIGGTCLNQGCIPTKALRASTDALEAARRLSEYGIIMPGTPIPDLMAMQERKNKIVSALRAGLEKTAASHKIRLERGNARLISPTLVRVTRENGETIDIESERIILAMGSTPFDLPGMAPDNETILNSNQALELKNIPERLLIVGGGVIGCEFACIFQALGTKVTIVQGAERLLAAPGLDADISRLLQREMKKRKINVILGATVSGTEKNNGENVARLAPSSFVNPEVAATLPPIPEHVSFDKMLITVGRAANSKDMGLEEAGVALDSRGWVITDEYLRTSVPNIYAIGDILGPKCVMLAHVAAHEAFVTVANCLGGSEKMDYSVVPSGIFTSPEIASVGLSEEEAQKQGIVTASSTVLMRTLGKAHAMGEVTGQIKIVAEKEGGKLLGVHMMGAHATDIVGEAALALRLGATASDLAATIHAHPTLTEGVFEAAVQLAGWPYIKKNNA